MSNDVAPTTASLGNSTLGSPCTWEAGGANLTGSATGLLPGLLSTAIVGGIGYGGTNATSLMYTSSSSSPGGYDTCALGSSYNSLSVGFEWKTSIPATDTNQYDDLEISSADGTDRFQMSVTAEGGSLYLWAECTATSGDTTSATGIQITSNTVYWVWMQKNTSAANNVLTVFQNGVPIGTSTCASGTGSHPASIISIAVTGDETETAGYYKWWNSLEISTSGAQMGPSEEFLPPSEGQVDT